MTETVTGPPTAKKREHMTRSLKARVAAWIQMRAAEPGISNAEVAKRLGISTSTLQSHITRARRAGLLKFDDPLEKLEFEIIPKVVENLNHFLDAKDRTVTIEAAKGTIFKQFAQAKGIHEAPTTVLAIKLEYPEGEHKVVSGHVVGHRRLVSQEKVIEGEVTDE